MLITQGKVELLCSSILAHVSHVSFSLTGYAVSIFILCRELDWVGRSCEDVQPHLLASNISAFPKHMLTLFLRAVASLSKMVHISLSITLGEESLWEGSLFYVSKMELVDLHMSFSHEVFTKTVDDWCSMEHI